MDYTIHHQQINIQVYIEISGDKWKIFKDLTVEPTSTVQTTDSSYSIGTLVSNIEGGIVYTSLNDGTTTLTSTVEELNYVDGVTSSIQTQIDSKQPNLTAGIIYLLMEIL